MNREESKELNEKISKYIGEGFYSRSTADYQSEKYKEENPDAQETFSVGIFNSKPPYGCLVVICSEEEWEVFKDICRVIALSVQQKEKEEYWKTHDKHKYEYLDREEEWEPEKKPDYSSEGEEETMEKPGGLSYEDGKHYR